MRVMAHILSLFIALVIFCDVSLAGKISQSAEREAVAIAGKVKGIFLEQGPEKALEAVNDPASGLKKGDIYPFIGHVNGFIVAHYRAALRGQGSLGSTDRNGVFYFREMIKAVRSEGKGWVTYDFPNPSTEKLDTKKTWVEALDKELFVAVGVYSGGVQ